MIGSNGNVILLSCRRQRGIKHDGRSTRNAGEHFSTYSASMNSCRPITCCTRSTGWSIFLICVGIRHHSTDRWSIDPDLMIRMLMVGYCSVIRSASAPIFHGARAIGQAIAVRFRECGRGAGHSAPRIATKHLFGRNRCRPGSPKKGTQRKRFCDIQFGRCGLKEVRAGSAANDFQLSPVSKHWLGKRAAPRLKTFMRPKRRWKPGVPMLMAEDGTLSSIFLQCRSL